MIPKNMRVTNKTIKAATSLSDLGNLTIQIIFHFLCGCFQESFH